MAPSASEALWARPRNFSEASSNAWMPSDTRLTPAARNPAKRPASTEVGLASSVISSPGVSAQCRPIRSIKAETVAGSIRDGVPPPKKTDVTVRPGVRAA